MSTSSKTCDAILNWKTKNIWVIIQQMQIVFIYELFCPEFYCFIFACFTKVQHWDDTLTHWGRVTHICVDKIIIIGSDNGLSPGRLQAIIRTNADTLLTGPWEQTSVKFQSKFIPFHSRKHTLKCRLENGGHFVSASLCCWKPSWWNI